MKRNLKPWILSIASLLLMAFVVPAFGATEITPQEKKLIPAAKKEGTVILLEASWKSETTRRLAAAFVKHYGLGSDFQFKHVLKGTSETVGTMVQEIKAKKFTFDLVSVVSPGVFYAAAKQKAFLPLDSGQWKNHAEPVKQAGQLAQYPHFVVPYAYTFQPVWNVACPGMEGVNITSYSDILDNPKLKGKILVSDVTKSSSYSFTTLGLMEAGYDVRGMWKTLKTLDPLVAFRTEDKMQRVVNCERPVDMWNLSGRALQKIREKPELAKGLRWGTYKEGQVMFGMQAAVPNGVAHPNAGKLLLEFFLTKEAVDIVAEEEASYYSFLKGYKPPEKMKPYMIDFDKVKLLGMKDWIAGQRQFKAMHAEWEKIFR
jgi:ABC-type Fe3+ transport system substrate-binding protein